MSGAKQQTLFQSWGNKTKEQPNHGALLALDDGEEDEMLALAMEESLRYAGLHTGGRVCEEDVATSSSNSVNDPQPGTSGCAAPQLNSVAKSQWNSLFKTVGQPNQNKAAPGKGNNSTTGKQPRNFPDKPPRKNPAILTTDDVPDDLLPDPSQFPDLPGFDKVAGRMWIYPTNYPVREYQFNIVYKALFENTLCVLPTGLGKTFIAAVVMYNFYRWYPSGKIVFMAPTKPLVAQQIEACYNIMGIPQSDTAEMTGAMQPSERKRAWQSKRIFFLTPQVMVNDLTRGAFPAEVVRCLVCDEAHKATGNHAYCQVVRELSRHTDQYRILALSATPGSDIKAVQTVVTNMNVANIELRSEDSDDIRPYTHERIIDKIVVPLGEELTAVREKYFSVISVVVNRLQRQGVLYKREVKSLSKFLILKAREAFRQNPPMNMPRNQMGIVEGDFALCMSLYHGFELLQQHGLRSLTNFLEGIMSGEKGYGRTRTELQRNADFCDLLEHLRSKYAPIKAAIPHTQVTQESDKPSEPVVTGHPKMNRLEEVAVEHFRKFKESEGLDEKGSVKTRIMIFSQYRDSVTEITEILNQHRPLIKAMSFIGQSSAGKSTKGFTQKEQLKVMRVFREGGYNTLISTCVGEEGLDIGDVDLIICFDAHKSPIRLVQRMGRTGRKRQGRIVMLLTEGKEEQTYNQSQYSKRSIDKAISRGSKSLAFYDNDHRLVPEGMQPVCHKMHITIQDKFDVTANARRGRGAVNAAKKPSSARSKGATVAAAVEDDGLLTEDQMRSWQENLKVDEPLPLLPRPGQAFVTLQEYQDDLPDIGSKRELSLSSWLPWQNRLQGGEKVGSSSSSKHLVEIMEFIDLQGAIADDEDTYGEEMQLYLNEDDIVRRKKKKRVSILNYCTPVNKEGEPVKKRKKETAGAGVGANKRRRVIPEMPVISSDEEPPGGSSDDDLPQYADIMQNNPKKSKKRENKVKSSDTADAGTREEVVAIKPQPVSEPQVIQIDDDSDGMEDTTNLQAVSQVHSNDIEDANLTTANKSHMPGERKKSKSKQKLTKKKKKTGLRGKRLRSAEADCSRIQVIGDHDEEDFDHITEKSDTSNVSTNKNEKSTEAAVSDESMHREQVRNNISERPSDLNHDKSKDENTSKKQQSDASSKDGDALTMEQGLVSLLPLSGEQNTDIDMKVEIQERVRVPTPPSHEELEAALDELDRKGRLSPVDLLELVDLWQAGSLRGFSHGDLGLAEVVSRSSGAVTTSDRAGAELRLLDRSPMRPQPRASFMLPSSQQMALPPEIREFRILAASSTTAVVEDVAKTRNSRISVPPKSSITSPIVISAHSAFRAADDSEKKQPSLSSSDLSVHNIEENRSSHAKCKQTKEAESSTVASVYTDGDVGMAFEKNSSMVEEDADASAHARSCKDNLPSMGLGKSDSKPPPAGAVGSDDVFQMSLEFEFADDLVMEEEVTSVAVPAKLPSQHIPHSQIKSLSDDPKVPSEPTRTDGELQQEISPGNCNKILKDNSSKLNFITPFNSRTFSRLDPSNASTPFTSVKVSHQTLNASSCHQSFLDNDLDDLFAGMQTPHTTPGGHRPTSEPGGQHESTPGGGKKGADSTMFTFTQALDWVHQGSDAASPHHSPVNALGSTSPAVSSTVVLHSSSKPANSSEASESRSGSSILSQRSPTVRLPSRNSAAWESKQTVAITPMKIQPDDELDEEEAPDSPVFGPSQRFSQRCSSESPVFGSSGSVLNRSACQKKQEHEVSSVKFSEIGASKKDDQVAGGVGLEKVEPAFDLGFDLLDEFGDDDDDMMIPPSPPSTQPFSQTSLKSRLSSRFSATPKTDLLPQSQLLPSDDEADKFISQTVTQKNQMVTEVEYVDIISDSERLSPSLLDPLNDINMKSNSRNLPLVSDRHQSKVEDVSEKHVSMLSASNLQNLVDAIDSDDDFDVGLDEVKGANLFPAQMSPSKLQDGPQQSVQLDEDENDCEESFIAPPKRKKKRAVPLLHSPDGPDTTAASKSDESEIGMKCVSKQTKKKAVRRVLVSSEEEETPVKKRPSTSSKSSISSVSFRTSVTDEDDDFVDDPHPNRQQLKEKCKERNQKKKKKKGGYGQQFLEVEAELSGDDASSDENDGSDEDALDASFINDLTQMSQQSQQETSVDMRAIYMQSVRSPGPAHGRFRLAHHRPFNKAEIFSQVPREEEEDESQYLEDSFVVDTDEDEEEEAEYSDEVSEVHVDLNETVGVKTRRGRQRAALRKGSKESSRPVAARPRPGKRRIVHMIDSSSEEEAGAAITSNDARQSTVADSHRPAVNQSSHVLQSPSKSAHTVRQPSGGVPTGNSHQISHPVSQTCHGSQTSQAPPTGLTQLPSLASRCQNRLGSKLGGASHRQKDTASSDGNRCINSLSNRNRTNEFSESSQSSDFHRKPLRESSLCDVPPLSASQTRTFSRESGPTSQTSPTGLSQLPSLTSRCQNRLSNLNSAISEQKSAAGIDPAAAFDLGMDLLDDDDGDDDFDDAKENSSANIVTDHQFTKPLTVNQSSSVISGTVSSNSSEMNKAPVSLNMNSSRTAEQMRQERIRLSRLKQQQFREKYQARNSSVTSPAQDVQPPAGQEGRSETTFLKPGPVAPSHSKLSRTHDSLLPTSSGVDSGSHTAVSDRSDLGTSVIEEFPDTPVYSTPDLTSLNLSITDTSMNQRDKLTILVDSREINGAQELVSSLRFQHNCIVSVCQLSSCDYVLSNRMAAERKSMSDFSNGANRAKLTERIQRMCDEYERPCLIIEKDRVKTGQLASTKPWVRTKTVDNILACLSATHIKVLYSENQEETASILSSLAQTEHRKQMHITAPVTLSAGRQQVLQWYQTIPGVSYVMALNLLHGFSSVQQFVNSPVKVIEKQGKMSAQRARELKAFVLHKYDRQMTALKR